MKLRFEFLPKDDRCSKIIYDESSRAQVTCSRSKSRLEKMIPSLHECSKPCTIADNAKIKLPMFSLERVWTRLSAYNTYGIVIGYNPVHIDNNSSCPGDYRGSTVAIIDCEMLVDDFLTTRSWAMEILITMYAKTT